MHRSFNSSRANEEETYSQELQIIYIQKHF